MMMATKHRMLTDFDDDVFTKGLHVGSLLEEGGDLDDLVLSSASKRARTTAPGGSNEDESRIVCLPSVGGRFTTEFSSRYLSFVLNAVPPSNNVLAPKYRDEVNRISEAHVGQVWIAYTLRNGRYVWLKPPTTQVMIHLLSVDVLNKRDLVRDRQFRLLKDQYFWMHQKFACMLPVHRPLLSPDSVDLPAAVTCRNKAWWSGFDPSKFTLFSGATTTVCVGVARGTHDDPSSVSYLLDLLKDDIQYVVPIQSAPSCTPPATLVWGSSSSSVVPLRQKNSVHIATIVGYVIGNSCVLPPRAMAQLFIEWHEHHKQLYTKQRIWDFFIRIEQDHLKSGTFPTYPSTAPPSSLDDIDVSSSLPLLR